jgi:protein-S-isoprenylcysteine O-methyltransferase Ste14
MVGPRSVIVALVMLGLFYVSFDSGIGGSEPAPPGVSGALVVFTIIFGFGAWATNASGDPKRSQMFVGVAAATGLYGLGRLVLG